MRRIKLMYIAYNPSCSLTERLDWRFAPGHTRGARSVKEIGEMWFVTYKDATLKYFSFC